MREKDSGKDQYGRENNHVFCLIKNLGIKLILTFVVALYPLGVFSQYIEPDSRPIFRLDISKHNLALIS